MFTESGHSVACSNPEFAQVSVGAAICVPRVPLSIGGAPWGEEVELLVRFDHWEGKDNDEGSQYQDRGEPFR
jgi:hypothetical protein